ncbi:MAG: DUF4214 domain-containing protein [Pseudomonadota bacterium]
MIPQDSPLVLALSPYDPDTVPQGAVVTYGFSDAGRTIDTMQFNGSNSVSREWSDVQKGYVDDIFDYISTITNLSFEEVVIGTPTISFTEIDALDGNVTGFANVFNNGTSDIILPTVSIDPADLTMIHEIGHALGLSHPFDGPNIIPGSEVFEAGFLSLNNELNTRMSYNPGEDTQFPQVDVEGLGYSFGAVDIAALQLLFGANENTGLGDSFYGESTELLTIWDNGGTDSIDFSGATDNTVIDLRAATLLLEEGGGGKLSFVSRDGGTLADGGYTIAFGVEIENGLGGSGADLINGNQIANTLIGNVGDDMIMAHAGNDLLIGGAGNDTLEGGEGLDTAVVSGAQQSYTLSIAASGTTLDDRRDGGDGLDLLSGIESLTFQGSDSTFALEQFGGAATLSEANMRSFIELYIAYFDRAPDAVGLNFWGTAFAGGTSLQGMAELFDDQPETLAAYPPGLSNTDFALTVYRNVLGREPDQKGFDFWVDQLDSGRVQRDIFILGVLEGARADPDPSDSADERAQRFADRDYLSDKTDLGAYFSITKGLSVVPDAVASMALFTGTQESLIAARDAIDVLHDAAVDPLNGAFLMPLVGVLEDPFAEMLA